MDFSKFNPRKWLPRWLNPFQLVFVAFLVMLLFTGENNYLKMKEYKDQINELKAQIKANEDTAARYEAKARELHTDRETLEKIARENYGMKRTDEDVYVTDMP